MALAASNKTAAQNTTDQTSYTTASVAFLANRLYLFAVESHSGTSPPALPTLTGTSLTIDAIANATFNTLAAPAKRISLYRAMPGGDTTTTVTISFAGATETQNNCSWSIDEFTGMDTGGTNGAGAIVQSGTQRLNSVTTATVTLAALQQSDNGAYGIFGHSENEQTTPGSGFTELADVPGTEGPTTSLQTEWALNDNTVDASWTTTSNCGAVAVEVKIASAGTIVLDPMGMTGFFGG